MYLRLKKISFIKNTLVINIIFPIFILILKNIFLLFF
jgi:hypothetical protein